MDTRKPPPISRQGLSASALTDGTGAVQWEGGQKQRKTPTRRDKVARRAQRAGDVHAGDVTPEPVLGVEPSRAPVQVALPAVGLLAYFFVDAAIAGCAWASCVTCAG